MSSMNFIRCPLAQNRRFRSKIAFLWKKVCYKSFFGKKPSATKLQEVALAYLSVQKWFVGDIPFYAKIWQKLTHPFKYERRFPITIRS